MFCPVCKAEYREGFMRCSDCGADLVSSKSEADGTAVETLWRGTDVPRFDEICEVLQAAGIPFNAKSSADADQVISKAFAFGLSALLWRLWPIGNSLQKKARKASQMEYEICVLARQHSVARKIMARPESK